MDSAEAQPPVGDPLTQVPPGHRSGFVGIVGKPNVGKSTILNAFLKTKVAITSSKPQTTRTRILGILTRPDAQVVFVDSPGWHQPIDPLGRYMMASARQAAEEADVLVVVIDPHSGIRQEDRWVFDYVRKTRAARLLAINKADAVKKEKMLPLIEQAARLGVFEEIIPISAVAGDNMDVLLGQVIKRLPEGPRWYEPDRTTDQTTGQYVREVIREEILKATRQEVPHAVAVLLDDMTPKDDGVTVIRATILVEREGQKGILIGKGGLMLKRIGQDARLQLEQYLGQRVFLELWVKVAEGWRDNQSLLNELGYGETV